MANVKTVVSYTLAAMAGIFFVKGLALSLDRGSEVRYGPR